MRCKDCNKEKVINLKGICEDCKEKEESPITGIMGCGSVCLDNDFIGIAMHNAKAGDMVTIQTNGEFQVSGC